MSDHNKQTKIKLSNVALDNSVYYDNQVYKNGSYWSWGRNNLYPNKILNLKEISPTHASILMNKINFLDSFEILGVEEEINLFNEFSRVKMNDMIKRVVVDYVIFDTFTLKIKPTQSIYSYIDHINVEKVRVGTTVDEYDEYNTLVYCNDWSQRKGLNNKRIMYPRYDKSIQMDSIYRYVSYINSSDIYNEPTYSSAINNMLFEYEISNFALANTKNGWSPRLSVTIFGEYSDEEQDDITRMLSNQYQGTENAGKPVMLFTPNPEDAPKIEQISYNLNDGAYLSMIDNTTQKILSAHQCPNPAIAGLAVNGGLDGNASSIQASFQLFDDLVLSSKRKTLEVELNTLFEECGWSFKVKFNKFELTPIV
jgi:hypothetical protein